MSTWQELESTESGASAWGLFRLPFYVGSPTPTTGNSFCCRQIKQEQQKEDSSPLALLPPLSPPSCGWGQFFPDTGINVSRFPTSAFLSNILIFQAPDKRHRALSIRGIFFQLKVPKASSTFLPQMNIVRSITMTPRPVNDVYPTMSVLA